MTSGASPQWENGYTKIADELLEALPSARLSGGEFRIVLAIIRKTYGFNKKMDRISLSQFETMTGIPRKRCHKLLGELVTKNVVLRDGKGRRITYGPQKDYTLWPMSPRKGTAVVVPQKEDKNVCPPREGQSVPQEEDKVSPCRGNTINTKQKTLSNKQGVAKFPFDSWQVQIAEEFHAQLVANDTVPLKLSEDWKQDWADVLDKCHRLDGKPIEVIRQVALYPQTQTMTPRGDDFCWADNFTTLNKLRMPMKKNKQETYFGYFEKKIRRATRGKSDGSDRKNFAEGDRFSYAYK